jgi:hypothetical protein
MDNMFDDFFNIGPPMGIPMGMQAMGNGPIGVLNVEIVPMDHEDHITVTNVKDVTPKALNTVTKPQASKARETEIQKLEGENLTTTPDKEIAKLEEESLELDFRDDKSKGSPTSIGGFSLGYVLKYSIYAIMLSCFFGFLFVCFSKIVSREEKEEVKHTINDIEDELRGIKDKNKIF